MGDYAITKIILKVKKEYQEDLKYFISHEKASSYDYHTLNMPDNPYTEFWESLGITDDLYYESYPFSSGSFHAYTTILGNSDVHETSNFYIDTSFTTRFEDGFWFVEFSSKVNNHDEFYNLVVPKIAVAWVGLTGGEYQDKPDKLVNNLELITSNNKNTQIIIEEFLTQFNNS